MDKRKRIKGRATIYKKIQKINHNVKHHLVEIISSCCLHHHHIVLLFVEIFDQILTFIVYYNNSIIKSFDLKTIYNYLISNKSFTFIIILSWFYSLICVCIHRWFIILLVQLTCWSAVSYQQRFISPDIKVSLFILSLSLITLSYVNKKRTKALLFHHTLLILQLNLCMYTYIISNTSSSVK
jgi:hypothetical protein